MQGVLNRHFAEFEGSSPELSKTRIKCEQYLASILDIWYNSLNINLQTKLIVLVTRTIFLAIGPMYSDAGLLGAMVVAEAGAAGKVVSAVAATLRSAAVTEAEVTAAKKNLIADVLSVQGSTASLIEDIGTQVINMIG